VDGGKCCSVLVDNSRSCAWVLDFSGLVGGMAGVAASEDAGDEPAWIEEVLKFESSKVLKCEEVLKFESSKVLKLKKTPKIVVIPNGVG